MSSYGTEGSSLAFSSDVPETEDLAGYQRLTWTQIDRIQSIQDTGETQNYITTSLLSERKGSIPGTKDGGHMIFHGIADSKGNIEELRNMQRASFRVRNRCGIVTYFEGVPADYIIGGGVARLTVYVNSERISE